MSLPILAAPEVPWSLARSADGLRLQTDATGRPLYVEFTACFRAWFNPDSLAGGTSAYIVGEPEDFRPARPDERSAYHRLRVNLEGGFMLRWTEPYAEGYSFDPNLYDEYSKIPVRGLKEGETPAQWVERSKEYQHRTGYASNPCVYEVEGSDWLMELGLDPERYKHIMFDRDSEPFPEVIAEDWSWELGQPTQ